MIFFNVSDDPYDKKLIKVQYMFELHSNGHSGALYFPADLSKCFKSLF